MNSDTDSTPDGHNDLMIYLRTQYKNHIYSPEFKDKFENGGFPQHVDLPRLDAGRQGGAFWSAFMP
jgi:membrane dipeptidase